MAWATLPVFPFLIALYLSVNGAISRKLSPSGAVTAFLVGFALMSTHVRAIGISLIAFYLLASKATKRKSFYATSPCRWLDEHRKRASSAKLSSKQGTTALAVATAPDGRFFATAARLSSRA